MCSEFLATALGGLIAGVVGLVLFFLQRCYQSRDDQRKILFKILQLIQLPVVPAGGPKETLPMLRFLGEERRSVEIDTLSFLVKDKKLSTELHGYFYKSENERRTVFALLTSKLNPDLWSSIKNGSKDQNIHIPE